MRKGKGATKHEGREMLLVENKRYTTMKYIEVDGSRSTPRTREQQDYSHDPDRARSLGLQEPHR